MKGIGPLIADSGDGWLLSKIKQSLLNFRMSFFFSWADFPQSIKTTGLPSKATFAIISSVSSSQPFLLWLLAIPSTTVRTVLRSRTPCLAQPSNSPVLNSASGYSLLISLKMFLRLGGGGTSLFTENANPFA